MFSHPWSGITSLREKLEEGYPLIWACLPEDPLQGKCLEPPSVQPGVGHGEDEHVYLTWPQHCW